MSLSVEAAPEYPIAPHVRTHFPRAARPYREYRDCLRLEFVFTCSYCLSNEREVAPSDDYAGFEIEHFKPQGAAAFKHLRSYYPNLLWSCHACNRAKGDEWPSDAEISKGLRFVDPTLEALGAFLRVSGDKVEAVDGGNTGSYMIATINLNSKLHIERRRRRRDLMKAFAMAEETTKALRQRVVPGAVNEAALQAELDHHLRSIEELRRATGVPASPPWDAPTACLACQPVRTSRRRRRK